MRAQQVPGPVEINHELASAELRVRADARGDDAVGRAFQICIAAFPVQRVAEAQDDPAACRHSPSELAFRPEALGRQVPPELLKQSLAGEAGRDFWELVLLASQVQTVALVPGESTAAAAAAAPAAAAPPAVNRGLSFGTSDAAGAAMSVVSVG